MSEITAAPIDLQPFCGRDAPQAWLERPVSRGNWTWATDGHILVRVPRRPEISENPDAAHVEHIWSKGACTVWRAPLPCMLPAHRTEDCPRCAGTGRERDCLDGTSPCGRCDGSGVIEFAAPVAVGAGLIHLRHAHLIVSLPAVEIGWESDACERLRFRCAGAEGIVSALRLRTYRVPVAEI